MDRFSDTPIQGTPPACLTKPKTSAAQIRPVDFDSSLVPLPSHLNKPRLRRWEASEYLLLRHGVQIAPGTLAKLASIGGGPSYHVAVRTPLYPTAELDAWALARLGKLRRSSSEVA